MKKKHLWDALLCAAVIMALLCSLVLPVGAYRYYGLEVKPLTSTQIAAPVFEQPLALRGPGEPTDPNLVYDGGEVYYSGQRLPRFSVQVNFLGSEEFSHINVQGRLSLRSSHGDSKGMTVIWVTDWETPVTFLSMREHHESFSVWEPHKGNYYLYCRRPGTYTATIDYYCPNTEELLASQSFTVVAQSPGSPQNPSEGSNPVPVNPPQTQVKTVPLTGFQINESNLSLNPNESVQLTAGFEPENTTVDRKIRWEIKDPAIASVSETGILTGYRRGKTEVIATASDGTISRRQVYVNDLPKGAKLAASSDSLRIPAGGAVKHYSFEQQLHPARLEDGFAVGFDCGGEMRYSSYTGEFVTFEIEDPGIVQQAQYGYHNGILQPLDGIPEDLRDQCTKQDMLVGLRPGRTSVTCHYLDQSVTCEVEVTSDPVRYYAKPNVEASGDTITFQLPENAAEPFAAKGGAELFVQLGIEEIEGMCDSVPGNEVIVRTCVPDSVTDCLPLRAIQANQELFETAAQAGKKLTFEVESGTKADYALCFSPGQLGPVNLLMEMGQPQQMIRRQAGDDRAIMFSLTATEEGVKQLNRTVRLNLADRGYLPGKPVFLYEYQKENDTFLEIQGDETYETDELGRVSFDRLNGAEYLVTANPVDGQGTVLPLPPEEKGTASSGSVFAAVLIVIVSACMLGVGILLVLQKKQNKHTEDT